MFVPSWKPQFPVEWRILVKEGIANIVDIDVLTFWLYGSNCGPNSSLADLFQAKNMTRHFCDDLFILRLHISIL